MSNLIATAMDDADDELRKFIEEEREKISSESEDELKKKIALSINVIGREMLLCAMRAGRLAEMGIDLGEARCPYVSLLLKIDAGQVDAMVVVRFSHWIGLLEKIANLPLPDQKRLGRGEKVPVVVIHKDEYDTRMMDVDRLSGSQLAQVFSTKGEIRDEAAQICYLENRLVKNGSGFVPLPKLGFTPAQIRGIKKTAGASDQDLYAFCKQAILSAAGLDKKK